MGFADVGTTFLYSKSTTLNPLPLRTHQQQLYIVLKPPSPNTSGKSARKNEQMA